MSLSRERRMWSLFEPIHAVTYFAPQARSAFEAAGLRGFWRGYFAGRSAPLGPVGPGPVIAAYFGFAPQMVTRALPDVWTRITPAGALEARLAGAVDALRSAVTSVSEVFEVSELLRAAALGIDRPGRVLGSANADLPWPEGDPFAVLWHAATVLREHRGDGHVAALLVAGLDGCESLVWRASLTEPAGAKAMLQPARGWTDDEWAAAADRLASRGWLTADGLATDEARQAYADAEATTDRLARCPWDRLGEKDTERCRELLAPIAREVWSYLPQPNPIGLIDPA
jgi:hypothetical protein